MIYINIFTFVLAAFICNSQVFGFQETIDQTPLAATCTSETTVKVFSSILFIDLISAHDPEVVFSLKVSSEIAADNIYNTKLRILLDKGYTNAETLASTTVDAVSIGNEFTIPKYFIIAGNTIGDFLAEKGLLSCGNVIQRVAQYFTKEERVFKSLESVELGSYLEAILLGLEYLLEDLGYTTEENEENWQTLTDIFYRKYNNHALR